MVGRRSAFLMAISLGLVAAVVLIQLKSSKSKNILYEVSQPGMQAYPIWPKGGRYLGRQFVRGSRYLPKLADGSSADDESEEDPAGSSAFPPEENAQQAAEEPPVAASAEPTAFPNEDQPVDVSNVVEEHEEPQEPDNFLGDEVFDLPKVSDANDYGDMYLNGKDVEQNRSL